MTTIEQAEWAWLKPHLSRGALFLVDPTLDLLKVSEAMEKNNVAQVQEWLRKGLLSKVTSETIKNWDDQKKFNFSIIQPFVLISEFIEIKH